MEVAGLAFDLLGPLSLVYKNCAKIFKDLKNFKSGLDNLETNFDILKILFENERKILLMEVVLEEKSVDDMLADGNHPLWKDEDLKKQWHEHVGSHYDKCIEAAKERLENIDKILTEVHRKASPATNAESPASQATKILTKIRAPCERIPLPLRSPDWCLKKKNQVKEALRDLKKLICVLESLRKQRTSLEDVRQRQLINKTIHSNEKQEVSIDRHSGIFDTREAALQLYNVLASATNCQCHQITLKLHTERDSMDSFTSTQRHSKQKVKRFRMIVACEHLQQTSQLDKQTQHKLDTRYLFLGVNAIMLEPDSSNKSVAFGHTCKLLTKTKKRVKFADSSDEEVQVGKKNKTQCADYTERNTVVMFEELHSPKTITYKDIEDSSRYAPVGDADEPVSNLCALLSGRLNFNVVQQELLGTIQSQHQAQSPPQYQYRNEVYHEPPEFCLSDKVSLEQILRLTTEKENFFPTFQRFETAYLLSLSLLQYGSWVNSWFNERWRSSDIYYFLDLERHEKFLDCKLEPYITPTFPASFSGKGKEKAGNTDPETDIPDNLTWSEELFSLAVVLIEIAFACPLSQIELMAKPPADHSKAQFRGFQAADDVYKEYMKAIRVVNHDMLYNKMGPRYAKVVRRCLFVDFVNNKKIGENGGQQGASSTAKGSAWTARARVNLGVKEVQDLYYENVIEELGACLKGLRI